jgi:zinc protease
MNCSRTFAALALATALSLPAPGLAQVVRTNPGSTPSTRTTAAPRLPLEKYKLKNGLEVILLEDHRLPLTAVNLWYHVGPANEKKGRTGFAHLFEHMMFQGSRDIAEPFQVLEAAGASEINGTTDFDRTNYFETVPSNRLETALWLESDRMGFLQDKLDAAQLENQRDVVRNERREGENRPYELVEEGVFHTLFPKGHPYYAYVIGSHADIEAAELNDVRDFHKQYYSPNNASLAIVGDIDKAKTKAMVEKYFGSIPAGPPVPKIEATTPPITSERRAVITDKVELPRVYMAWITDPIYKPGDAQADVLAQILGGGKSSRLYKKLVYEKQIAQSVDASQYSLMLGSVFEISATARPGVKPEDLEKAIDEELTAVAKSGPTAAEMERARNTIQASMIRGLERLGGFGGVADRLNQYNHFLGNPDYLAQDLARYQNATAASVQKLAAEELARNKRVVVYGVPGEKVIQDVPKRESAQGQQDQAEAQAHASPQAGSSAAPRAEMPKPERQMKEAWRATPPPPAPSPDFTLPVPKRMELANGLTVLLVEQHQWPVISASIAVLSGADANPLDRPGLASFTADMLDEGTTTRPALQLADDIAQIGAILGASSSTDSSSVSLRVLKQNVDRGFDLLSDVTLNPAFSPQELQRIRQQRLVQLLQERDNPRQLASRVFSRVVFGSGHPYGFQDLGTEESNKAITREEVQTFWKTRYLPGNAALVVTGDVSESEVRALADKYFGNWAGSKSESNLKPAENSLTRHIVIVDNPGAPQTQLRIGHIGIARNNPDYIPLGVMNAALGGNFSSRINMNLREEHGYTYGAFSAFSSRRVPGPFVIGAGVRTDATAPAVAEVFKEVERMRREPISPQELALAKDSIARSLPGMFETTASTANSIGSLFVYGLPLDYYRDFPARVDAVDASTVQQMGEKYLKPEQMVIVAIGDRAKIEPGLKKLDLGAIELRDSEGNLFPQAKGAAAGK